MNLIIFGKTINVLPKIIKQFRNNSNEKRESK